MDMQTLKVGDRIGVARSGSWVIHSEGIYTVVKVDKVKVVIQRDSDKYERTFSVKTGLEKGTPSLHSPWLETEEEQLSRNAQLKARDDLANAWKALEAAARNKSLVEAEVAIAELKKRLAV